MNGSATLDRIRVVLVRPSHPGNVGAAARAMKTMGVSRLALVQPRVFPHAEAHARASGATDVLERASVWNSLPEALGGVVVAAGLSARRRDLWLPQRSAREAARELVAAAADGGEVALVFGTETSGLSNDDMRLCHLPVFIPANPEYSSLNLAAAVQVLCYELRQMAVEWQRPPVAGGEPATVDETEAMFVHLERSLGASGFLDPANPKRLMPRLRRMFGRVRLEREEVNILRGMLNAFEKVD